MIFGKTINCYYKKYWYYFFFGILALIAVDAIQLLIPEIVGEIARLLNNGALTDSLFVRNIVVLTVIAFSIFAGRVIWRLTINGVSHRIEADMRRRLFGHCEHLASDFYATHKTGATMALLTNDLEAIKMTFSDGVIFLIDVAVLGSMAIVKMAILNWVLALITLIPLAFLIISGNIMEKLETKSYEKAQKSFEDLSDFTTENITGISVVKAFIKEREQIGAFERCNQNNRSKQIAFIRLDTTYNAIINLLIYFGAVSIVILGGYFALKNASFPGIKPMDGPGLFTFFGYFDALIWPILACVFLISTASRGKASYNRVTELLQTEVTVKDRPEAAPAASGLVGDIVFNNLSFTYPDGQSPVLKDFSVHIKPGENIGIIGRTGSGKTTFVNMLLKLYNVPDGMIAIDGKDINLWSTKDIRDAVGYVAQDTFLFSATVANNIAFSNPELGPEAIEAAARFACVDDNIRGFKEGYQTMVGERGVTLSGGQKQRIAMARAIVKNPQILILDDSVSAVDSSTEKSILKNIRELRQGKTTLIVAHRISAVENLDHIIVLDEGHIAGYGTHSELLKSNALYQQIVRLQELEKEVN